MVADAELLDHLAAHPAGGPVLRMYRSLPEHYQIADERDGHYPLLRFLTGVMLELGNVDALTDRIDYIALPDGGAPGDTSDLTDPMTADATWLTWLGQLIGVRLDPALSEMAARDAVAFASAGWRAGTKSAVADAAKSELTGTKYAAVYDHSSGSNIGAAGPWDVLVVTRPTETPDPSKVLAAIVARGAKPAGVKLYHLSFEGSWTTLETGFPTWNALEAAGSWDKIQEAGL